MGTNYYVRVGDEPGTTLHIGKSGWMVQAYTATDMECLGFDRQAIFSLSDWMKFLMGQPVITIHNEYGETMSLSALSGVFDVVDVAGRRAANARQIDAERAHDRLGMDISWADQDWYTMTKGEWS